MQEQQHSSPSKEKRDLLVFQLGPVQDFIAQARSTRDLWSGSFMLSWLMAHALNAVVREGQLRNEDVIMPSINRDDNPLVFFLRDRNAPPKDEAEVQRRVREAAAFVGLSDELLEKSPFELSGGQKRRVAIAGVMAMHPRVLVLDEPAAGLDPEGRDTILSQIRDYHEKTGITVLLVSHSMEDIAKYANRVLVMHRAKIAMYDTVENVFARAQALLELGLSVPQVTQIFLKLRQMGLDIPADVYTIPYAVKTIQKALAAKQGGGADA